MRPSRDFAIATVVPWALVRFANASEEKAEANAVDTTRAANTLIQSFIGESFRWTSA
jgi:hypothetical protein